MSKTRKACNTFLIVMFLVIIVLNLLTIRSMKKMPRNVASAIDNIENFVTGLQPHFNEQLTQELKVDRIDPYSNDKSLRDDSEELVEDKENYSNEDYSRKEDYSHEDYSNEDYSRENYSENGQNPVKSKTKYIKR